MRTVRPRFEVKRRPTRRGPFKYTVVDNDRKQVCGTNGWPEDKLIGIIGYAAMLNEAYKYVPRLGAGTASEENFEEA